ncbi:MULTISPECIES: hypothetical protein [Ralstonia]|jgi:hypothetical protein|uniref:Phage protein n=1 Tax=Ralstonia flaminis TaxID=3058597 RepID=A0ABM9K0D5_9RALS|nr:MULTISPECIES: hypothetical protein [unclassified Ralstonia]CAJ0809262.1 hypothetical protein LMG18101_00535 [Ralstonia sp. LMG 18101]
MSDFTLKLGQNFQFKGLEIPETISFGGTQKLALHDLVGGTRVIDSMGAFCAPVEWSGWLLGTEALARARELDDMRVSGREFVLQWSEICYIVVIREFRADFQRAYKIPYKISCEVSSDMSKYTMQDEKPSIDGQIKADAATATDMVNTIGDGTLSDLITSVNSAIDNVASFANAAQSTLSNVVQKITAFRDHVQKLVVSANNALTQAATLGGILPNNALSQQVTKLTGQINSALSLPVLVQLDRLAGRMQTNIASVYKSAKHAVVVGGDLMKMAAKEYNDAMAWTALVKANPDLAWDPLIQGIKTLIVPPNKDNAGGLPNP